MMLMSRELRGKETDSVYNWQLHNKLPSDVQSATMGLTWCLTVQMCMTLWQEQQRGRACHALAHILSWSPDLTVKVQHWKERTGG